MKQLNSPKKEIQQKVVKKLNPKKIVQPNVMKKLGPQKPTVQQKTIKLNQSKVIKKDVSSPVPGKKNVFLLWLISVITLGIYPSIWYIQKARELNDLQTPKKLKKGVGILNLILIILSLALITTIALTSPIEAETLNTLTIILLSILGALILSMLIVILFLAFRTRTIINQALTNKGVTRKVSGFFTFVFNFLYLQYEINRIMDDKENLSRTGPWLSFIFLVFLPILTAIAFLILTLIGIITFS